MPSWNQLIEEVDQQPDIESWINNRLHEYLMCISKLRGDRCVILYLSGFLQKPQAPPNELIINHEDVNGLMSILFGMDCSKGLTMLLHTPGGVTNAAESIVAYLRSKFPYIEVIIPTFAMSAGTM